MQWTSKAEQVFQVLKKPLTTALILKNLDYNHSFIVQMNTLEAVLGAMLSPVFEGEERPVLYISGKLSPAEKKYVAVERVAWSSSGQSWSSGNVFLVITSP